MPPTRFQFSPKTIPFAFAILIVLGYGLLLTRTGFYWDDWPFAWGAHFFGPESFLRSFLRVRPFLGPIFYVTTSLLPENPLAWQIFALVVRLALSLAAWWALRNIWPDRPRQTLTAALIFLVYPGYSQHWVAFTHINQELIPLFFYLLSFGATGWAFHNPSRFRPRTVIALLLLILGVFPTEYFLTIEPLRFLFLFSMLAAQPVLPRAWQAIKLWIPYVLVWSLNLAWLLFFHRSGLYANYDVALDVEAPASNLLSGFFAAAAESIYKAGLVAHTQILTLVIETFPSPSALLTLALIAITFAALTFYLSRLPTFTESVSIRESATKSAAKSVSLRESAIESVDPSAAKSVSLRESATESVDQSVSFRESVKESAVKSVEIILIGLLGILLGRIPSWAAGLPLTLQSSNDRFTISMILAASLLAVGVIELVARNARWRLILVSLLVALGIGGQFYNANTFRRDWERQRDIYWQFTWRMPAIQPGTVLFTDTVEIDYETDYILTAPLNWIYASNLDTRQIPYLIFGVDMRPKRLALDPDTPIEFHYRPAHFSGNTSQSIAFLAPLRGCVRILAPGDEDVYQNLSERMQQAIALSNLDLILPEPTSESASIRDSVTESAAESASLRDSATKSAAESASLRDSATKSAAESASLRDSATKSAIESASLRESATKSAAESASLRESAIESAVESAPLRDSAIESVDKSVFGPEPPHGWCYYYARAELARQFNDWEAIARLDTEAANLGLTPTNPLEWLPFVEAGASLGQFDQAAIRTRQAIAERPFLHKTFCAAWNRASQRQDLPDGFLDGLGCQ